MENLKPQFAAVAAVLMMVVQAAVSRPAASAAPAAGSAAWADDVEAGADHVTPAALADLLLTAPHDALVIDVRPAAEFAVWTLPGAVNLDVPALLGAAGTALLDGFRGKLVVLVSEGMTHPAQAWTELARRGRTNVRVLEDGLAGFKRDVLTPPSLRAGMTAERAAAAWPAFRAACAAFLPRRAAPQDAPKPAAKAETRPVVAGTFATDPETLTKPTVVSTAWVAKRGAAIVVVDARDKAEDYAAGHVPGAVHVPASYLRGPKNGVPDEILDPSALAAKVGARGVDEKTEVVVYAGEKLQDATLTAVALLSLGHEKVAVMEGGFSAWKAEGRALSTEAAKPVAKTYVPRPAKDFVAMDATAVDAARKAGSALILDSRPPDQFSGEATVDDRGGHIPGSKNRPVALDWAKTDRGLFWRTKEELAAGYAAAGVTKGRTVVAMCRSGHQATQSYFTLKFLLGHDDVRLYDGSWKDWAARSELPVETGPAK